MADGVDDKIDTGWVANITRRVVSGILQHFDRLPSHVGIVMDGNRRFARQQGVSRKDGHSSGFKSMNRLLATAYAAKISEITVYAFSIENFNRSDEEVADIMDLARSRLAELVAHKGLAQEYGIRIRIFGRLELLPEDLQQLARHIMASTERNNRAVLNLAMPYTARDDIAEATACVAGQIAESSLSAGAPQPLSTTSISEAMYTSHSRPLDLLIRTSDTRRLSDFLLWEINEHTVIDFVPELWPEYTPLTFLGSVLRWRSETHSS